jgi:hypothetical protein
MFRNQNDIRSFDVAELSLGLSGFIHLTQNTATNALESHCFSC